MFAYRATVEGDLGTIEVAFTDSRLDVGDAQGLEARDRHLDAIGVECGARPALMNQVHGAEVHVVADGSSLTPVADALVCTMESMALLVRVADCVPVLLADPDRGIIAVAHAGRVGLSLGVVAATVATMRRQGARDIDAWIGPHICGSCYEVPLEMRAEVAAAAPASFAVTRKGTPALDIGAGVASQLHALGCRTTVIDGCTLEDARWPSYRRDGAAAGRMAGVIWRNR